MVLLGFVSATAKRRIFVSLQQTLPFTCSWVLASSYITFSLSYRMFRRGVMEVIYHLAACLAGKVKKTVVPFGNNDSLLLTFLVVKIFPV